MILLCDLGSTSTMEDGRELSLEVMRGRKEWYAVVRTVHRWMLSGPVVRTYMVNKNKNPPPKKDNIACQNLKSKYLIKKRVVALTHQGIRGNHWQTVKSVAHHKFSSSTLTSRFRTLTTGTTMSTHESLNVYLR